MEVLLGSFDGKCCSEVCSEVCFEVCSEVRFEVCWGGCLGDCLEVSVQVWSARLVCTFGLHVCFASLCC